MDENRVYNPAHKIKDKSKDQQNKALSKYKLYSCSLPYSLDLIKLNQIDPKSFYIIKNKKGLELQYTDSIINVSFLSGRHEYKDGKKYRLKKGKLFVQDKIKGKVLETTPQLRNDLYKNGFAIKLYEDTIIEFVLYKRSSSKARQGSHLFIKKDSYETMIKWSRMNMEFKPFDTNIPIEDNEIVDIASLKAYESLTLSGIEGLVTINPNEILLINDLKGEFKCRASITRLNKEGKPEAKDDETKINNLLWDGQSLADTSLFSVDENGKQKGMMLLRNRWFKSCAFNTNIQKWFNDCFDNKPPEYLKDMFNRNIKTSKVKLITTPSSLKLFKFSYKISNNDNETEQMKECYQFWLKNISYKFGICKNEKPSHFGNCNRLSYQMLNSLPLDKDEIGVIERGGKITSYQGLLQDELYYIELLKNDISVFRHHINNFDISPSREFIFNLLAVNDKVQRTKLFKDFRKKTIDNYIKDLRKGKIKITNSDYAVLIGNPIEMLQYATFGKITNRLHSGNQIYCPKYDDSIELVCFRNPNICAGNVFVAKNIYKQEFSDYLNLTDNIVTVNSFDSEICDRLQGQDFDSDSMIINSSPILVTAGKKCEKLLTPISRIESKPQDRYYSTQDMVAVDNAISKNLIGDIVNWSQLLNSYYWDYYWDSIKQNKKADDDLLNEIYNKISVLSSLSQLEIDKAKKYVEINTKRYIDELHKFEYDGNLIIKKDKAFIKNDVLTEEQAKRIEKLQRLKKNLKKDNAKKVSAKINNIQMDEKKVFIRPIFFKYCAKGKRYKFEAFNTSMDYLQNIIDDIPPVKNRTNNIDISEIVPTPNFSTGNKKQIIKIKHICTSADSDIKSLYEDDMLSDKERYYKISDVHNRTICELQKISPNNNTLSAIIYRVYSKNSKVIDKDFVSIKMRTFGWLYKAYGNIFMECFNKSKGITTNLIKANDNDYDYIIFGEKYKKVNTI